VAATPSQTLVSEAQCYTCLGEVTPAQTLRLALFRRILLAANPMAATDTQSLITYSQCYICLGMTQGDAVELALLDQIMQASGGGGGSSNVIGSGDPIGVVTPDVIGQLYTNTAAVPPQVWQATGLTSADWTQLT
jgi:hypothetical protein